MSAPDNSSNTIKQLAYISEARPPVNENSLLEILESSRDNNVSANITGFLMYGEHCFLQVIEGPQEDIDLLYAILHKDPRHHSLIRILYRDVESRLFSDWRMAFRRFETPRDVNVEGFSEFLENYLENRLGTAISQDTKIEDQQVVIDIIQQMRTSYLVRG